MVLAPEQRQTLKSVDELVQIWEDSVGRGGQLVLGIAPDKRGLLPEADVKRLEEMGQALQARYGADRNLVRGRLKSDDSILKSDDSIAAAVDADRDTFWSAPDGSHHATLELQFKQPVTFDTALSMEWLNDGQLVQKYAVEVFRDGAWVKVAQAQAIGHMKIDHFPAVTASRVRLNILSSVDAAHIREFQLFNVGAVAARCSLTAACNRSRARRCRVRLFRWSCALRLGKSAGLQARFQKSLRRRRHAPQGNSPLPPGEGRG
ncbi:discoidin domain-containing protein [Xanthomonas sontii]|uniref:discoidin domain-containing protein n=1 Tax=Xanthomonas sontii TaxID=2650745 RepID=UPI001CC76DAF|nr:discoidin domain-containing protein [Xanthomonas sontii]